MMESLYSFDVPFQLLQLYISQDKAHVFRLEHMGPFRGNIEACTLCFLHYEWYLTEMIKILIYVR